MDEYHVRLTTRALQDLDDIYAYIAQTLLEPQTARALIDDLETQILSLSHLPFRCPRRTVGAYAAKGYRQLLVKNYTVIYRIDDSQKQVIVLTVRYARSAF